jgi:hypothetical protein
MVEHRFRKAGVESSNLSIGSRHNSRKGKTLRLLFVSRPATILGRLRANREPIDTRPFVHKTTGANNRSTVNPVEALGKPVIVTRQDVSVVLERDADVGVSQP